MVLIKWKVIIKRKYDNMKIQKLLRSRIAAWQISWKDKNNSR